MFRVSWSHHEEYAESVEVVDAMLDRLHREFVDSEPTCVTVELDGGDSLTIGLGGKVSILNYVNGSGEPPYFISHGNTNEDGTVWFEFFGDHSEFSIKNTIPIALARIAMREFCKKNGELTKAVGWEEV